MGYSHLLGMECYVQARSGEQICDPPIFKTLDYVRFSTQKGEKICTEGSCKRAQVGRSHWQSPEIPGFFLPCFTSAGSFPEKLHLKPLYQ